MENKISDLKIRFVKDCFRSEVTLESKIWNNPFLKYPSVISKFHHFTTHFRIEN